MVVQENHSRCSPSHSPCVRSRAWRVCTFWSKGQMIAFNFGLVLFLIDSHSEHSLPSCMHQSSGSGFAQPLPSARTSKECWLKCCVSLLACSPLPVHVNVLTHTSSYVSRVERNSAPARSSELGQVAQAHVSCTAGHRAPCVALVTRPATAATSIVAAFISLQTHFFLLAIFNLQVHCKHSSSTCNLN